MKDYLIANGIKYPEYNDVYINVFNTKRLLVIFILSALMLYGGLRSIKMQRILPYLMVSILTIDLFFAHYNYYFITRSEDYHRSSESMGFILNDKKELFRVFTTPKTKKGEVVVSVKENNEIKGKGVSSTTDSENVSVGIDKEIIHGYNLERRIFDMDGVEVMRLSDYEKVSTLLITAPGPGATNLLALLNVKYVLSTPKIEPKEFRLVKIIRPVPGKMKKKLEEENFLKIYQNLNYLPRAFLVEGYRILKEEQDFSRVVQDIRDKTFHPAKEVLLYEEPWNKESLESRVQSEELIKTRNKNNKKQDEVSIVDYRNNSITLSVNTDRPKILVLSETYYPGWKAYVDGQEKKILKANFAFRAIPLSAGQHEIEFIYDPWTFKIGLYITLATIISLLSFGIFV
ncbi:MAG: YfhO family protein, partial [Patescibacteria group bacterium]